MSLQGSLYVGTRGVVSKCSAHRPVGQRFVGQLSVGLSLFLSFVLGLIFILSLPPTPALLYTHFVGLSVCSTESPCLLPLFLSRFLAL